MLLEETHNFWNEIGSQKHFEDAFYPEKLAKWVDKDSSIIEYGCGYGRILNQLWLSGYHNTIGFDIAPKMLQRAREQFPHLHCRLLDQSASLPKPDRSVDCVVICTVLVCNPERVVQEAIIAEIKRILKPGGYLYISEYLITHSDKYHSRYAQYASLGSDDYGVLRASEGTLVRHHKLKWLLSLLEGFDLVWLEQFQDVTMNGNAVNMAHMIGRLY